MNHQDLNIVQPFIACHETIYLKSDRIPKVFGFKGEKAIFRFCVVSCLHKIAEPWDIQSVELKEC